MDHVVSFGQNRDNEARMVRQALTAWAARASEAFPCINVAQVEVAIAPETIEASLGKAAATRIKDRIASERAFNKDLAKRGGIKDGDTTSSTVFLRVRAHDLQGQKDMQDSDEFLPPPSWAFYMRGCGHSRPPRTTIDAIVEIRRGDADPAIWNFDLGSLADVSPGLITEALRALWAGMEAEQKRLADLPAIKAIAEHAAQ